MYKPPSHCILLQQLQQTKTIMARFVQLLTMKYTKITILNWDGRTEKEVLFQCGRNVTSSCVEESEISIDLKKLLNEFLD